MDHDNRGREPRDALALLRALRADMPAPEGAERHVSERLTAALALGDIDSPYAGGDPVSHVSSAWRIPLPRLWGRRLAPMAGWALVGAAATAGAYAVLGPRRERVVYVDRPVEIRAPLADEPTARAVPTIVEQPIEPPSQESPLAKGEPPAPAEARDAPVDRAGWTEERMLLDLARRKLSEGEPRAALETLGKHTRRFPHGKLVEERDALLVNALVLAGEFTQARAKIDSFRARYPTSFLSPSVEAAAATLPR